MPARSPLVARPGQAQRRSAVAIGNDQRPAGLQRRDDSRIELRRARDPWPRAYLKRAEASTTRWPVPCASAAP